MAKISNADRDAALAAYMSGVPSHVVGKTYGLSSGHIRKIAEKSRNKTGNKAAVKGRPAPGNQRRKLSDADRAEIRCMYRNGIRSHVIAEKYGVSSGYVRGIGGSLREASDSDSPLSQT
jgi:uncharacterized protein YjcR